MFDGGVHGEPLGRGVLARDDDVHVVAAPQAMIHNRQQAVRIGRHVDAHHLGLPVDHVVDEAGVLMRKAVVVLPPDMRSEQVVQRGDLPTPGQM